MKSIGFPLFDLKASKNYIFIAGGGGSKDYGKDNGIVAIRKDKINKESSVLYKTIDFITQIEIYTENEEEKTQEMKRIVLKESPKISDTFETTDESEEEIETNTLSSKKIDTIKDCPVFITAIGEEFFYFLKFDESFSLISKINKKITSAHLSNHLIILKNHTINGFNDVLKQKSLPNIKTTKINEDNTSEEYVYKLYTREKFVVALNEHCTSDIPENWSGFFIDDEKIHKILKLGDKNEFVFRNKKHTIEGNISKIIVYNDNLVLYSNKDKNGYFYFIHDDTRVWKLPKITAIAQYDQITCISTCTGELILYSNGVYLKKYDTPLIPLTGIALDGKRIYFSQLTGNLDSIKYNTSTISMLKVSSLVVLVICILIAAIRILR